MYFISLKCQSTLFEKTKQPFFYSPRNQINSALNSQKPKCPLKTTLETSMTNVSLSDTLKFSLEEMEKHTGSSWDGSAGNRDARLKLSSGLMVKIVVILRPKVRLLECFWKGEVWQTKCVCLLALCFTKNALKCFKGIYYCD